MAFVCSNVFKRKANSPIGRKYKPKQLKMSLSKVLETLFGNESDEADDVIMPRSPIRRVRPQPFKSELSTAPPEEILPQPPVEEAPVEKEPVEEARQRDFSYDSIYRPRGAIRVL
jgi:hypothetical protein